MCTIGRGGSPPQGGPTGRGMLGVLFHNPGEKTLTILKGDVIGHTRLAGKGKLNPELIKAMKSPNLAHAEQPE